MGITLFTVEGLLAPLRSLMKWLARAWNRQRSTPASPAAAAGRAGSKCGCIGAATSGSVRVSPRLPVRIVRVVEPSHAPASAGRMFISGRMADVCAELDRLATADATAG